MAGDPPADARAGQDKAGPLRGGQERAGATLPVSPEAMEAALAALRAAVSQPAQGLASRTEWLPSVQAVELSEDAAAYGSTVTALAKAGDAVALATAAAKAMRLLLHAQAAAAPEPPPSDRRARREQRRQHGLAKQQQAAVTADKGGKLPPLARPVESLPGVGPTTGLALRARGLCQVADLLWFLPLGYRDERKVLSLDALEAGEFAVTTGTVLQVRGGRVAEVMLSDPQSGASLRLCWFRAARGMMSRFRPGMRLRVSGTPERFRGQLQLTHPQVQTLGPEQPARGEGIVPRYGEVPGLGAKTLAKAVAAAVAQAHELPNAVPVAIARRLELMPLPEALRQLHQPAADLDDAGVAALLDQRTAAHRRLAFEEFFLLELSLHLRREEEQGIRGEALVQQAAPLERALAAFPFELTTAQARVLAEITQDLNRAQPMRRLLQGDVGSGKTAVALLAAAHAISAGAQVAFMAPTEILAEQHFRSLTPIVEAMSLRAELLVGGARAGHRRKVLKGLAAGTIDLAIGTHALLSEGVDFNRLRLVIVDEQHRFGVAQRLRLVEKGGGLCPHLLVMTATPIPRSLTLALYGDLACSIIDEKPKGRLPPVTRAYRAEERDRALHQLARALESGGQGYVVCPAIEEAEDQPLRTAEEAYRDLSERFADYGVALLHGRLTPEAKADAMTRFHAGVVKLLVATTVIEVGVDVPAANVILIEHAERFGLAQLHQLRGRVGRGGQRSACLLVHEAKGEEARERIRALCETDDGFRIAEQDLRLRGPGEVFGRRQSGLPGFRFGDLRRDTDLLACARDAAAAVIERDPELSLPEHAGARDALQDAFALGGGLVKEEAG